MEKSEINLKKQISEIIEIPIQSVINTNLEEFLYAELEKIHADIFVVRLIYKFKASYDKSLKETLYNFIISLLFNPELCKQSNAAFTTPEAILSTLLTDTLNEKYDNLIHFLFFLDEQKEHSYLLIKILEALAFKAKETTFFDDNMKFTEPLITLVDFQTIQNYFSDEKAWKTKIKINRINPNDSRSVLFSFLTPFIYNEKKNSTFERFLEMNKLSKLQFFGTQNSVEKKSESLYTTIHKFLMKLFYARKECRKFFINFVTNTLKENQERAKTQYDPELADTDGVICNLNGVLTKLCDPIITKNLGNLINPAFLINFEDFPMKSDLRIKENKSANESFTSCVFFCKIKSLQLGIVKVMDEIRELNRKIYMLETYEMIEARDDRLRLARLTKYYTLFKSKVNAFKMVLRTHITDAEFNFQSFSCKFFNSKVGSFLTDFYIKNKENNEIICTIDTFPEFIFQTIFRMQLCFRSFPNSYFDLAGMIFNTQLPNVSFKSTLINTFDDRNVLLNKTIFLGLLKYYVELDKLDDFNFDRTNTRSAIVDILSTERAGKVFKMKSSEINTKFLHSFLKDIKKNITDGLTAIKEIREYHLNIKKYVGEELEEARKAFMRNETKAKYCLEQLDIFLIFLKRLISENHYNLFANRLIINNFIGILNCNLKTIVGPSCSSLKIEDKKKYNFEPRNILNSILSIYIIMYQKCKEKGGNVFLENIIDDSVYFNINFFKKALEISINKYILGDEELRDFKIFFEDLSKLNEDKKVKDEDVEIPDEFIDPLTFVVMENPVKLLTSGKIIDMETFEMLLLGDSLDPFSREVLSKDKIEVQTDLQEKIDEWFEKNG